MAYPAENPLRPGAELSARFVVSGMNEVAVRQVRPGDGQGCARAWADAGRYYAAIVPEVIQEPDPDGLAEWFERGIAENRGQDTLWLVATVDETGGQIVGMIDAVVQTPHADGRWQLQRDQSRTRLLINALAVTEDYRRRGVGTLLMNAAEEWGHSNGATIALTDTNLRSDLSVPFYEARMGYQRQAVILRKPLDK
jgi:GNAT superfamily N-acetyltransferase